MKFKNKKINLIFVFIVLVIQLNDNYNMIPICRYIENQYKDLKNNNYDFLNITGIRSIIYTIGRLTPNRFSKIENNNYNLFNIVLFYSIFQYIKNKDSELTTFELGIPVCIFPAYYFVCKIKQMHEESTILNNYRNLFINETKYPDSYTECRKEHNERLTNYFKINSNRDKPLCQEIKTLYNKMNQQEKNRKNKEEENRILINFRVFSENNFFDDIKNNELLEKRIEDYYKRNPKERESLEQKLGRREKQLETLKMK